jgi:hypothetical protein
MTANCPPQVATVDQRIQLDELGHPLRLHDGLGAVLHERLGRIFCGIQGHEHMTQFNNGRIFLRCITCGHESPGWDIPTRLRTAKIVQPKARRVATLPSKRVA